MLKIILQEYEINKPEIGNYFYLYGVVMDENFTGSSKFVIFEPTLKKFYEELKEFSKKFHGDPELIAGWGDDV